MLYIFFWVIPRRLNFICRRFGTLCLFHLHRQVGVGWLSHSTPTCLWRWNRESVPKCRHIKFRHRGITQKKLYNVKLDHTNDSNIMQVVQENVALTHEGTRNQTLNNLSVLTALHSRKEGIWHSNDDTWGEIFCLAKLKLQMATWYAKVVKKRWGETDNYRLSSPHLQHMPTVVHGMNSAQ